MCYVSFVEIFVKSQLAFADSGLTDSLAYVYATLCFFGGAAVMLVSYSCCCDGITVVVVVAVVHVND